MRGIARVYYSLPAKVIVLYGMVAICIGSACWMGVILYGKYLYYSSLEEGIENGGTAISANEIIIRIYIGRIVSCIVLLAGAGIVVLGIAKMMLMPYLKTQKAEQLSGGNGD